MNCLCIGTVDCKVKTDLIAGVQQLVDIVLKREPKDQDRASKLFTDNLHRVSSQLNEINKQKKSMSE